MGWFNCRTPEPEPEPEPRTYDSTYDGHSNVSGRAPSSDVSGLPRAEGTDPGEPMPVFHSRQEFPGGAPGLGKRR